MKKHRCLVLFFLPFLLLACAGPGSDTPPGDNPVTGLTVRQGVFRKNYPLTFALEQHAATLDADSVLALMGRQKLAAVQSAPDGKSAAAAARLTESEMATAGDRLAALAGQLGHVAMSLKKCGAYRLLDSLPDTEFLRAAWMLDAQGMNHALDVFALGETSFYPQIDRMSLAETDENLPAVQEDIRTHLASSCPALPFYKVTLEAALTWLDANGRFEAMDFEPIERGINKAVLASLRKIRWKDYPYSVILILGCGPTDPSEPISAQSRMRAQHAAALYRSGKAPLVVVSGGRVHPMRTPHSEAEQMKHYLMETWGIPECAILAEPHARHTTTNLRNTIRLMMRYGIPLDKPGLVTSGRWHIDYVCGDWFPKACKREMRTMPFTLGKRINARELEFQPLPTATQVSSLDPLDP